MTGGRVWALVSVTMAAMVLAGTGTAAAQAPPVGPSHVGVGIFLDEVSNVDTARETFTATFEVSFRCFDRCSGLGDGFEVENGNVLTITPTVRKPTQVVYRIRANLEADFDISDFPFDEQTLPIKITATKKNVKQERYLVDERLSGVRKGLDISGWSLTGTDIREGVEFRTPEAASYATITFAAKIERADRIAILKYLLPVLIMLLLNVVLVVASKNLAPKDRVPLAGAGVILAVVTEIASLATLPNKDQFSFLDAFTLISVLVFLALLIEPLIEMSMQDEKGKDKEEFVERRKALNRYWRWAVPIGVVVVYGLLFLLGT
jgi:hypothetical protein